MWFPTVFTFHVHSYFIICTSRWKHQLCVRKYCIAYICVPSIYIPWQSKTHHDYWPILHLRDQSQTRESPDRETNYQGVVDVTPDQLWSISPWRVRDQVERRQAPKIVWPINSESVFFRYQQFCMESTTAIHISEIVFVSMSRGLKPICNDSYRYWREESGWHLISIVTLNWICQVGYCLPYRWIMHHDWG